MLVCDFCSSPDVCWSYPASSFVHDPDPSSPWLNQSVGGWAACEVCHDLIEADRYKDLLARSVLTLLQQNPEMRSGKGFVTQHIAQLHSQFRKARTGPPTRVDN